MVNQLNRYGICLERTKKYTILDDIGNHFLDRAAKLVKSGFRFVYVLDNIDWEEKAHDMRKDVQNRSVHAVVTSIVFNRIPNKELSDSGPQQDLKKCNMSDVLTVNNVELETIRSRYRVIVARILFEHFTEFQMFKPYAPQFTECTHAKDMSAKSEVVTMPVMMKDEKKIF